MNMLTTLCGALACVVLTGTAQAANCNELARSLGLTYTRLTTTLQGVVPDSSLPANLFGSGPNGGLGFPMWLSLVDGSGRVCAVTHSLRSGESNTADIWLGSRVISAQKANTANAFSLGNLALSTANLYAAVQPGGSLFGLQESNPVNANVAYSGASENFGTAQDPLLGQRVGGVNVFGGGLALYAAGVKVGAIGVSGDTSCTDHVVAWKVRAALGLAFQAGTTPPPYFDQMVQTVPPATSLFAGFTHPLCLFNPTPAQAGGAIY